METKKPTRRIARGVMVGAAVLAGFVWLTNAAVLAGSRERIFTNLDTLPHERVALVLGTSPTFQGQKNLFFERRMMAAAELYRARKVERILVSGDHGTPDYDEPRAMRASLAKRGVPEAAVVMDFAGFRTLDSVIRAKRIFGVDRCTIVTDDFHLPRALHIAEAEGMRAIGFQTEPLPRSVSPITYLRETGARTMTWVDVHILNRQPKFLGRKERL